MNKRPDFIPKSVFRQYMSAGQLGKYFMIGESNSVGDIKVIKPQSFIQKCESNNRPVKTTFVSSRKTWLSKTGKVKKYRPIDICARVWAGGHKILPPKEVQVEQDADRCRKDMRSLENELSALKEKKAALKEEKNKEQHKIDELFEIQRTMEEMAETSKSLTMRSLLSEEEICEHSVKFENTCGVYFLIKNNKIVYVGQSVNAPARIPQHTDKDFDSFAVIRCEKESLDALESLYIHLFKPGLNGKFCSDGPINAPISLQDLLAQVRRNAVLNSKQEQEDRQP